MRYYFAYGSNMLPAQMRARCPGARAIGSAALPDWRFYITTRGTASIRPEPGAEVRGALWYCEPAHLLALDGFEGVGWRNYRRHIVAVSSDADVPCLGALTYVGNRRYDGTARPGYLLNAVIPGARAFGLEPAYIEELLSWLPAEPVGGSRRYIGRRSPKR